jgi:hypothetical protein
MVSDLLVLFAILVKKGPTFQVQKNDIKTMKSCKNIMWTCPLYNLILDTIHFTPVTRLSHQGLRSPRITSCGRASWVSTALAAKECAKQIFSEA